MIIYSDVEFTNAIDGEWCELQVPTNGSCVINIGNNDDLAGDGPLFTFSTRFFLSDTQIPLDDLNALNEPPAGGNFRPLAGIPDGTSVSPGHFIEAFPFDLPEPSSFGLVALASVGLFASFRSTRRRAK